MDGGPYRAPQPADRRVVNRTEQPSRAPAAPSSPDTGDNSGPYRPDTSTPRAPKEKAPRGKRRFFAALTSIIVIALVVLGGLFAWSQAQNANTGIDTGKYQAVFFTNGQVYFGKLKSFNDDYMKMSDIYYLQTQAGDTTDSENPQQASTDQNNVQLIKLGSEVHGPEDEMIISRDQVLFYENLKTDGKVAQSIANYKTTN